MEDSKAANGEHMLNIVLTVFRSWEKVMCSA